MALTQLPQYVTENIAEEHYSDLVQLRYEIINQFPGVMVYIEANSSKGRFGYRLKILKHVNQKLLSEIVAFSKGYLRARNVAL